MSRDDDRISPGPLSEALLVEPLQIPDVRASQANTLGAEADETLPSTCSSSRFPVGRGLRLTFEDGTELLDAVSGTFNLPLGYDHPKVVAALMDQLCNCTHISSTYSAPYAASVLKTLTELAPSNIGAGWMRDITGSTANECAVKIAQKSSGKRDVLSLHRSHHGQTVFTSSISGDAMRKEAFPAASNPASIKVPPPYCYRCPYSKVYPSCGLLCAERIRDEIKYGSSGSVACIIVEPVLGNGGNIVPPPGYFSAVEEICEEAGILLIADEVQTGMGRTGEVFACESLHIKANIITLAKGLGGIGMPAAAVLMEPDLDVLEQCEHSFTSGGNMLTITAARTTLEVIKEEGFLAGVRARGAYLERGLRLLERYDCVGDIRGLGMMWGLEIVGPNQEPDPEKTNRIIRHAEQSYNLILRGSAYGWGNVVKVRPALIATEEDLAEIVERLSRAIGDVEAHG